MIFRFKTFLLSFLFLVPAGISQKKSADLNAIHNNVELLAVPSLQPSRQPTYPLHVIGHSYNAANLTSATGIKIGGFNKTTHSFGLTIAGVGDVNKDGYNDILTVAYNGYDGSVFLIYGKYGLTNIDLTSSFHSPQDGVVYTSSGWSALGYSLAGAGDINKDGYDDFLIGKMCLTSCGLLYVDASCPSFRWLGLSEQL
jgi:hypothetical protein